MPVFLSVSFSLTIPLWLLSPFRYYSITPFVPLVLSCILLLSSLSLSSPFCSSPTLLFKSHFLGSKVRNLFPRTPAFTPNLHLLFCLFYHSSWLTPPPAQTTTPPETHTRNVIDRTDNTSPFHSPALPIPPFHINCTYSTYKQLYLLTKRPLMEHTGLLILYSPLPWSQPPWFLATCHISWLWFSTSSTQAAELYFPVESQKLSTSSPL